ncbi:suppressor of fused domain protein [Shewanella xiamenensis]|uniref:Suppressor of fused-like domain-containing protein n=1 Tax=Shewanella sp. (strain MR-7) TaxID=60481 RepID=Q0HXN1_SHESR|nr:suppressor of fused domain protein [Shewanella xiamenensis]MCR4536751.1 suppressor of fused domain protein [Shewanella xiamenensis]WHF57524.1 suppressor of fused domain protein [Shewanella xiamenensis]
MNLEDSTFIKKLISCLGSSPFSAERFTIEDDIECDFLLFKDKPYIGVNSVFTNGARFIFDFKPVEFVFTYNYEDIEKSFDAKAFLATFIQLKFMLEPEIAGVGKYFKVPGKVMKEFGFQGVYITRPCYFSDSFFTSKKEVEIYWVIPVYLDEILFLEKSGSASFESMLESLDPDLCDLNRLNLVSS